MELGKEEMEREAGQNTLQKSMLFTPLLPSAGPTGGLGLACPAPTISFTTWSAVARTLDMAGIWIGGELFAASQKRRASKFWTIPALLISN